MNRIDPNCQVLRPVSEYCKRLPSRCAGKRLNRSTIWRWVLRGVGGWKLKTVMVGGGRCTCDAWVHAFIYRKPTGPRAPGSLAPISAEERSEIEAELAPMRQRRAA